MAEEDKNFITSIPVFKKLDAVYANPEYLKTGQVPKDSIIWRTPVIALHLYEEEGDGILIPQGVVDDTTYLGALDADDNFLGLDDGILGQDFWVKKAKEWLEKEKKKEAKK